MADVLVYGGDLMMYSRVATQLEPRRPQRARAPPSVRRPRPDVALCDVEAVDPADAVRLLRPARLLGFGSHDARGAARARAAGIDRVVARCAVAERLPALLDELLLEPLATMPPTRRPRSPDDLHHHRAVHRPEGQVVHRRLPRRLHPRDPAACS